MRAIRIKTNLGRKRYSLLSTNGAHASADDCALAVPFIGPQAGPCRNHPGAQVFPPGQTARHVLEGRLVLATPTGSKASTQPLSPARTGNPARAQVRWDLGSRSWPSRALKQYRPRRAVSPVGYVVACRIAVPAPLRVAPFSRGVPLQPKTRYRIVIGHLGWYFVGQQAPRSRTGRQCCVALGSGASLW